MKLKLERSWCGPECTIGQLSIDGVNECFTLEDIVRPDGAKVYGETAIPSGTYKVIISYSNRFKRDLPILVDVPGFVGIRIHPGNTAEDTDGCILVGQAKGHDSVSNSRAAFTALYPKIESALDRGDAVTMEVA